MPSNPLVTLSTQGILFGLAEKCDRLWSYFLTAQASQDPLYPGQVKSLSSLIALANGNPDTLQATIMAGLNALFESQFDSSTCGVTVATPDWEGNHRYDIRVDIQVTDGGKAYSVGKAISSINGKLQPLLTANNG